MSIEIIKPINSFISCITIKESRLLHFFSLYSFFFTTREMLSKLCIFSLFLLLHNVSSYPSAPGTCNMNKMATLGHGPSKSTCPDCYGVNITTDSPSLVNIHLTGKLAYQGIVLLVKDVYTNKTVGEFRDFDESLFTSVACDDDEDEEDQIEPDSLAVLGHIDPKLKGWPVDVGWNMEAVKPVTQLKLQGMIVVGNRH
ncbi:hypothetical protein EDC96DRAFT_494133 [Choanephora cucurbitarum]|nr:hypothetical protein EDC96DRAFT_494133 [Choanephora cucurbitarum]